MIQKHILQPEIVSIDLGDELKKVQNNLYELMTLEEDYKEEQKELKNMSGTNLLQNMNLKITNTMRKEGITINQIQSAQFNKVNIISVNCLKIINKLLENKDLITLKDESVEDILLDKLLTIYYKKGVTFKELKRRVGIKYIKKLLTIMENNHTRVAEFLDIQRTYIHHILNKDKK